jgi:hypothetical protein
MIYMIADRHHSKDASGHWDVALYDDVFLHRAQTNRARDLSKRQQIQPATFCQLYFSDLKGKNVNFHDRIPLAAFGHIWTIQSITMDQKWLKIRGALCFTMTAGIRFTGHKPLRLFALWNVEESLEKSTI